MTPQTLSVDEYVGSRIAKRRASCGLSQAALAGRIGVSFQQVQKYETGQNRVACSRLFKIAEVLDCLPGDLFPPATWEAAHERPRLALAECAALLAEIQPAITRALKTAEAAA